MNPSQIHISGLMTPDPMTLSPMDNLGALRDLFAAHPIHHVPVVKDGRLVGMVSITDYATALDAMTPFGNRQAKAANEQAMDTMLVQDLMKTELTTLRPSDYLEDALEIFKSNRFRSIPVVGDSDKLEGILTTYDVMMALASPADNSTFTNTK